MEQLELPELTIEQTETLCATGEYAARKYVLSKVPSKNVERLNVFVVAEGSKPLNLSIEVDLTLTAQTKDVDARRLADEATKQALRVAENYLRNLK